MTIEEIEKIVSQIQVDGVPMYAMDNINNTDRQVYWNVIRELENLITKSIKAYKKEGTTTVQIHDEEDWNDTRVVDI